MIVKYIYKYIVNNVSHIYLLYNTKIISGKTYLNYISILKIFDAVQQAHSIGVKHPPTPSRSVVK